MGDMHGNSLKTLRQNLLSQRQEFIKKDDFIQIELKLLTNLNCFLANKKESISSVAFYYPIQGEIDLRHTLLEWAKNKPKRCLALPFARPDKYLEFYQWQPNDSLILSKHGILEPNPNKLERPQIIPDCILIPCVGWSQSSETGKNHYWRLGYGGGYFDRTLAQLRKNNPHLLCVGIGFDWQQLNDQQWQAQTHDEPLDILITESISGS